MEQMGQLYLSEIFLFQEVAMRFNGLLFQILIKPSFTEWLSDEGEGGHSVGYHINLCFWACVYSAP